MLLMTNWDSNKTLLEGDQYFFNKCFLEILIENGFLAFSNKEISKSQESMLKR